MKKLVAICATALLLSPVALRAETDAELQLKLDQMTKELSEISKRLDATEKHTATDRIQFTGDLRVKADTLHYQDATWSPGVALDMQQFAADTFSGAFGLLDPATMQPLDPNSPIAGFMQQYPNHAMAFGTGVMTGTLPAVGYLSMLGLDMGVKPDKGDINNDIANTTRLRLNMKSKVANNVDFAGRL
ncbi:MAG: hypothetical protein U1D97_09625, partial [Desulfuromonadales bacterium]|nr:hypothetical protein [Desulfuromonadales bacterium]